MKQNMANPTPHFEKLVATIANEKLPEVDKPRIEQAIARYHDWIKGLDAAAKSSDNPVEDLVRLLNEYRNYIDIELVFDSPADFLYRQKGQLKLDNSVIEEFLPRLIHPRVLPELNLADLHCGLPRAFHPHTLLPAWTLQSPTGGWVFEQRIKTSLSPGSCT